LRIFSLLKNLPKAIEFVHNSSVHLMMMNAKKEINAIISKLLSCNYSHQHFKILKQNGLCKKDFQIWRATICSIPKE